jgi:hypothetical protein
MENLEGAPAILYSVFWQTKAMGHLKRILDDIGIKKLRILIVLEDYLPGALIILDGEEGTFEIVPVNAPNQIQYDGAFFGKLKDVLKLTTSHMIARGFWYLLTRKIKLKGIRSLLKFLKVIQGVAL